MRCFAIKSGKGLLLLMLVSVLFSISVFGNEAKTKAIDAYIKPFVDAGHFSGVVLVSAEGKIIYEKSFGLANAPNKVPNQPHTRFAVASITKPMTVVILARLIEEKKITLQDSLSKYIPHFPMGDKITIGMLAHHRSGIPHRVTAQEEETIQYTPAEMVEKIKKANLSFEPGSQNLYSSAGYTTLARVLEIASGKSYSRLLQEYVFKPAAMTDSVDFESEKILFHKADDYLLDIDGYINAPLIDFSFLAGAGSVFSTAKDIHTFGEAILDGKFGENVKTNLSGNDVFTSNGNTNGFRANVRIDRKQKYGYVVLSNLASGANDLIIRNIRAILEGKSAESPVVPKPQVIRGLNKTPSDFIGIYKSGNSQFEIFVKADRIYAGVYKLLPIGKDRFYNFWSYAEVSFIRDEAGNVKELEWNGTNGKVTWARSR